MSRSTVEEIIASGLQIEEPGEEIIFEIEGDDGSRLDRRQIEELMWRKRNLKSA